MADGERRMADGEGKNCETVLSFRLHPSAFIIRRSGG